MDNVQILDDGSVKIDFQIDIFSDSITLSSDDYNALSQTDIDNMKQLRYSNWLSILNSSNSGE